jgi:hypothetical protein
MRMLAARLERLSVDSAWAHRASGVRGNLLRLIEQIESGEAVEKDIELVTDIAFMVLTKGAHELRGK